MMIRRVFRKGHPRGVGGVIAVIMPPHPNADGGEGETGRPAIH